MRYQLNLSVDEKPDRITNKTGCAKALHVTEYAFRKDFPAAIRATRVKLWEDLKHDKSQHFLAKIAYPMKFVVDGQIVKDMFQDWG